MADPTKRGAASADDEPSSDDASTSDQPTGLTTDPSARADHLDAARRPWVELFSTEQQAAIHTTIERSGEYQKDLLRRLGVQTDLHDKEEFLVQLVAAARYVGISEKEFWNYTPRELCAVLEHRACSRVCGITFGCRFRLFFRLGKIPTSPFACPREPGRWLPARHL